MAAERISVIIVGAAFGGLSCAIELAQKGCQVHVFELAKDMTRQGDVITFAPNCTRIMSKWGNILETMESVGGKPEQLVIHDQEGRVKMIQKFETSFEGYPFFYASRTRFQQEMHKYAASLGVEFTFGAKITSYLEENDRAGVMYGNKAYTADFVIGADGVHSQARSYVLGEPDRAKKSGYALYRSWFSLDRFADHPLNQPWANATEDLTMVWLGIDIHAIITLNITTRMTTVFVTHRDKADIEESWHEKGEAADMLAVIEGWDPRVLQAVKSIPEGCLIDYKLLWRDPIPKWISRGGRVVLVGDAAHPHLPTSGTGGAQAVEDGVTLGVLIDELGKGDIPLALEAYRRLRFERVSLTQRMGWETRHKWHQTDWDLVAKDEDMVKIPQPRWLDAHDAEKYARENLLAVLSHLKNGTSFQSTNIPDGYVHEDWTVEGLTALLDQKATKEMYKT